MFVRQHRHLYEADAVPPDVKDALRKKDGPLMADLTSVQLKQFKQVADKYVPQLSTRDLQIGEEDFLALALKGVKKDQGGREYEPGTALFPSTIEKALRERMAKVIVTAGRVRRLEAQKYEKLKTTDPAAQEPLPPEEWMKTYPEWYLEVEQFLLGETVTPTKAVDKRDKEQDNDRLLDDLDDKQATALNTSAKKWIPVLMEGGTEGEEDALAGARNSLPADYTPELKDRMVAVMALVAQETANANTKLMKSGKPAKVWAPTPKWWVEAERRFLEQGDPKAEALRFMLQNSAPIVINVEQLPEDRQKQLIEFLNTNFPESNAKALMKTDPMAALGIQIYDIRTAEEDYAITLYPAKGKGWLDRLPDKLNPKLWLFNNKWATLLIDNLRNWMQKGVVGRNAGESELRMAVAYSKLPPQQCLQEIGKLGGVAVPSPEQIASKVRRKTLNKAGGISQK